MTPLNAVVDLAKRSRAIADHASTGWGTAAPDTSEGGSRGQVASLGGSELAGAEDDGARTRRRVGDGAELAGAEDDVA